MTVFPAPVGASNTILCRLPPRFNRRIVLSVSSLIAFCWYGIFFIIPFFILSVYYGVTFSRSSYSKFSNNLNHISCFYLIYVYASSSYSKFNIPLNCSSSFSVVAKTSSSGKVSFFLGKILR